MLQRRLVFALAVVLLSGSQATTQDDPASEEPSLERSHPYGDTPRELMLVLCHTDALPEFDTAEIFTISPPRGLIGWKQAESATTFPVRPYGAFAEIIGSKTIAGVECQELRNAWRKLTFDRFGGAMCHSPAYGLRFYRDERLIFETSVCWACQNFYLPKVGEAEGKAGYGWYGFEEDASSAALLHLLQRILPHPELRSAEEAEQRDERVP